jgi:hypothetical protein
LIANYALQIGGVRLRLRHSSANARENCAAGKQESQ